MSERGEQTWAVRHRESIAIILGFGMLVSQAVSPFLGYPPNLGLIGAGVTLLTGGVLFDAVRQK